MKYSFVFINQNPDFDEKLAAKRHKGAESEYNLLNLWEEEFDVAGEPESFEMEDEGTLTLQAEKNGEPLEISIPDCTVFKFTYADGTTTSVGASNEIIKEIERRKLPEETVFYVFLTSNEEIFRPAAGIYLHEEPEAV